MKQPTLLFAAAILATVFVVPLATIPTASAAPASLTVTKQVFPASIDLTAERTRDGVTWTACPPEGQPQMSCNFITLGDTSPYAHKNVTPAISGVLFDNTTDGGQVAALRCLGSIFQAGAPMAQWTDGDRSPAFSPGGNSLGGPGTSFTFPVTATYIGPATLTLYVGGFEAMGRLTVTLPGATPVTVDHVFVGTDFTSFGLYAPPLQMIHCRV